MRYMTIVLGVRVEAEKAEETIGQIASAVDVLDLGAEVETLFLGELEIHDKLLKWWAAGIEEVSE